MELAIHTWMRAEPIAQAIARLPKYGYKYLEIDGSPEVYNTKEVRKLLKEHNVKCWGSVTLMMEERNLLASSQAQREQSVQYCKDVITMVEELEGRVISLVPGTVGKVVPDARPDEEWQWGVECLKEIYGHAEKAGVTIGIEPINRFETYFVNRGAQALALAKEVGPNCGVCLDAFHMNIEETDMFETIKQVGDRLVNFHVADNNRFAPGMGTIDWPKVIQTLQEIGYNKVLSVEFCSPVDRTPANPFPDSIEENPTDLTAEMKKFVEDHGSSAVTESFYNMLVEKSASTLIPLYS